MAAIDFLLAQSDEEIASTFDVMSQLRPPLELGQYVSTMRELRASDGLQMIALREDGQVRAVATYRVTEPAPETTQAAIARGLPDASA
jgi:predicted transcriptional regulator